MSNKKKQIRADFCNTVFNRDQYTCIYCGFKSTPEKAEEELDAHHITDRNEMPNGGYVKENGATLCKAECHPLAEEHHVNGQAPEGYTPEDLYKKIGSSYSIAREASLKLAPLTNL